MNEEEIIKKLEDISYKIDEFVDLTLHGEIRNKVEDEETTEMIKEEQNYQYITTEILLERADEEIQNAIESIKQIYENSKLNERK